jgi:hypothetical protein
MLHQYAYWTVVWPLRTFYYPAVRLLGRIMGRKNLAERLIEVSEENIERTLEPLEGDE